MTTSGRRLCRFHLRVIAEEEQREFEIAKQAKLDAEQCRKDALPPMTEIDFIHVITGAGPGFYMSFRPTPLKAGRFARLVLAAANRGLIRAPRQKAKARIGAQRGWGVQLDQERGCLLIAQSGKVFQTRYHYPHTIVREVPSDELLGIEWVERAARLKDPEPWLTGIRSHY